MVNIFYNIDRIVNFETERCIVVCQQKVNTMLIFGVALGVEDGSILTSC